MRGDACGFAHGVFEAWLHPSRYRTQLCKDGVACYRSVCVECPPWMTFGRSPLRRTFLPDLPD